MAQFWSDSKQDGRRYKHPHTDALAPSVTTITGLVDKNLAQWGADQAVRWVSEHWDQWNPGQKSDERAFNSARYRWKDYRNLRAEVGNGVHAYIEAHIKGNFDYPELDAEQLLMVDQFHNWLDTNEVEFLWSERTFWDDKGKSGPSAGTADFACVYNGKRTLFDAKTSKSVVPEHSYQLAALAKSDYALVEGPEDVWDVQPVGQYDEVRVLHLRDSFWDAPLISNIEENYRVFDSYREVWYALDLLKQKNKQEEF